MYQTAYELLKEINDAPETDRLNALKMKAESEPVKTMLILNFSSKFKFDLPEGMPDYERDETKAIGLQEQKLVHWVSKMYLFLDSHKISKIKRESTFLNLITGLHHTEADVLIHVKDKALTELFPNITKELVSQYNPKWTE